jgi:invasion protein IalB
MKFSNILSSLILVLLVISCSQFGDSFRLPGEKPKDIIYFELDNDYLAPESREYIELNYSSNDVSNSYILIGKNTYGFEADLSNDMSLSFDEDGSLRKTREHPFLKDNFKKGKFKEYKDKEGKDREDKEEEWRDKDKYGQKERCFEISLPHTLIMPDGSTIEIEKDEDKRLVEEWYKDNPDEKERPKHAFPLTVVIVNDEDEKEELTLENEEELKELVKECIKEDNERGDCFKVVMPFSMELPDGSVITIEKEGDRKQIEEWYVNNPDSKERANFIFPIDIEIFEKKENEEDSKILTINDEEELKKALSKCRDNKGRKDRCKKLHGDEIPDCITEYVSSNFSDDKITHTRMLRTKDGEVFYVVKLKENGILKFNEDCEFLD